MIHISIGDFGTLGHRLNDPVADTTIRELIESMPDGITSCSKVYFQSYLLHFVGSSASRIRFIGARPDEAFPDSATRGRYIGLLERLCTLLRISLPGSMRAFNLRRQGLLVFEIHLETAKATFYPFRGSSAHDVLAAIEAIRLDFPGRFAL